MIQKVLIANRGEIAVRVCKTLHELGISSVAVYSDHDKHSRHVTFADEAHLLYGDGLQETYLNIEQLIRIAIDSQADAIHPGYGFLSESDRFSRAVREAGLLFIGPGDEAIRLMGNKVEARRFVEQLGVPVVKGATGQPDDLMHVASQIGYPILVKAAAGGGGKGMRIVNQASELPDVLETTQREAQSYFGNGEVYIEKYLDSPKHIEVQLIADNHGRVVCLFERECSIQRRYQKIVEEAPSPSVSAELRNQLMEAAQQIASAIKYTNAGTIEFLVKDNQFYFLEMNTRIQVEHPVTEMITGIDLVREQIMVAGGMPLPFRQEELSIRGHAIETRVYAEDPEQDFMPSPGHVSYYKEPNIEGVRIDSSMAGPGQVSRQFDPMISKVIAHGASREACRQKLKTALNDYVIHGIKNNIHYLLSLLDTEKFIMGDTDTAFCKQFVYEGKPSLRDDVRQQIRLAASCLFLGKPAGGRINSPTGNADDNREQPWCKSPLWCEMGYWRLLMTPVVQVDGIDYKTEILQRDNGQLVFQCQEGQIRFNLVAIEDNLIHFKEDMTDVRLFYLAYKEGNFFIQDEGHVFMVGLAMQLNEEEVNRRSHNPTVQGNGAVYAPMHGKIIKVHVSENDVVSKGDTLLVLESMKIENKILAPGLAKITHVAVKAGDVVGSDAPLVMFSDAI